MKTWKGLIAGVAIASMTLLSYPGISFGQDCSYPQPSAPGVGVFNPPLPSQDGFCVASGSLKTSGSLFVTASNWMFITGGVKLAVNEEPQQGFPFTNLPGSLIITPGGVIGSIAPILNPVEINAVGAINNIAGAINLWAPTDQIRLKAGKGISLQGDPTLFNPSSLLVGDTVKLETTRGDINLNNNTSIVSLGDAANVALSAPRGKIVLDNTTILVLKNGVEFGECTFQAKDQQVIFGPNTVLGCIPRIKK